MRKQILSIIIFAIGFLILPNFASAATYTLWDFDDPANSGHNWNGWTWYGRTVQKSDGGIGASGYGDNGWLKAPSNNQRPSSYENWDTNTVGGQFVTTNLPQTSVNSAFQYINESGTSLQWLFWHGNSSGVQKNLGELGLADSISNRMSFYGYLHGIKDPGNITGTNSANNFNLGTYLLWPGGSVTDPNESDNAHYYHYFNAALDTWVHFQPDNHPNWRRNVSSQPVEPAGPSHPYFSSMTHYYLQTDAYYASPVGAYVTIGDITLWSQTNQENDASVCNMWVGYWPGSGKWEIGFGDCSMYYNSASSGDLGGNTKFEVRWSTSPITNANWTSANVITPEYYRFGSTNSFRRSSAYPSAWTRFDLPVGTESANNRLYFAVKDMSATADGDYHNAPSGYVKTIDYIIRPGTSTPPPPDTTAPAVPTGFSVQ